MKIYGPYIRKDGRMHVIIVKDDKTRRTVSYPKYLMERELGRELSSEETVDHIDRNFSNNSLDNLQILDRTTHGTLDVKRVNSITMKCKWCNLEIIMDSEKQGDMRHNEKLGKAGPFCDRSCAGKYGAELKNNRTPELDRDATPEQTYYRLDKGE